MGADSILPAAHGSAKTDNGDSENIPDWGRMGWVGGVVGGVGLRPYGWLFFQIDTPILR